MNRWTIAIGILVIVIIAGIVLVILPGKTSAPTTGTSTPPTSNPSTTTPTTSTDITVTTPLPHTKITSPVTVTGTAINGYYFEASFPIQILDASGKVIGQGPAQAQSDWTVPGSVPFVGSIIFTAQPAGSQGTVVLKNDNPSGDPARDKHFDIPVTF